MAHIDTLKVYEEYRAAGLDDKTAKEYTNILENSFMIKVKELQADFFSNKLGYIVGSFIILVMGGIAGELWSLSKDVAILNHDMQEVRAFLKDK